MLEDHYYSEHPTQLDIEEVIKRIHSEDDAKRREQRKRKKPSHH